VKGVRRVSVLVFAAALAVTALTLAIGDEIKGARRWINVAGFSLQASEFLKPCFAVFAAWMFSQGRLERGFPGGLIATVTAALIVLLLISQPDLGMAGVVVAIWFSQLFMAGLPLLWVGTALLATGGAMFAAYQALPHVAQRINLFLDPSSGDTYQVDKSISAFVNGGLFGVGPGEGTVKAQLPDAHSDFIFAVAGEEFGLIACLVIVATYGFIVLRGFGRLLEENNLFVQFATVGLLVSFGLQAVINMGSSLHLMPTKGMTLPFISYGGSSLFALAFAMGLVMALTRRRAGVLA
jgi:cell division protein FtsW